MNLDLGNSNAGQFFTPYDVCRLMAQVTINDDLLKSQIEKHGWISINDCACGAGATLVAAANYLRSIGINYQMQALFIAQDLDATVALMCYIQLSLLGCAGYVKIGNTLTEPMTGNVLFGDEQESTWYTPLYFHTTWNMRRTIAMTESVFRAVATPFTGITVKPAAETNMPDAELSGNVLGEPESRPVLESKNIRTPALTTSTDKKNTGQIMFDFGGML